VAHHARRVAAATFAPARFFPRSHTGLFENTPLVQSRPQRFKWQSFPARRARFWIGKQQRMKMPIKTGSRCARALLVAGEETLAR
jgi:hypothetical protein